MGSRGDCFDNAVAESFFATSKRRSSTATPGLTASSFDGVFDYFEIRQRHAAALHPRDAPPARYEERYSLK
jgi:transposase InsO family protein